MHVLLDQKDSDTAFVDASDDVEVLLDQQRRKPERWLIDEQQLGRAHQTAPDRYHRLFAPRHRAGQLGAALGEPGENLQNLGKTRRDRLVRSLLVGADTQILLDG